MYKKQFLKHCYPSQINGIVAALQTKNNNNEREDRNELLEFIHISF